MYSKQITLDYKRQPGSRLLSNFQQNFVVNKFFFDNRENGKFSEHTKGVMHSTVFHKTATVWGHLLLSNTSLGLFLLIYVCFGRYFRIYFVQNTENQKVLDVFVCRYSEHDSYTLSLRLYFAVHSN